jgi:RimJ/RimL family protein N-acetyltransferase
VEEWVDSLRKENRRSRVAYGIFSDGKEVGIVSLHDIDYICRNFFCGIYVAERSEKYKGVDNIASQLALDFAFNAMGMNRVELEVLQNNTNAIHLYEKIGFGGEGLKRDAFFADGKVLDVKVMSILKKEFNMDDGLASDRLVLKY